MKTIGALAAASLVIASTAVLAADAANSGDTGKMAPPAASSVNQAGGPSIYTTVSPKDSLASKVVGLEVKNLAKQDIGTIKDVAFNKEGVNAYVLSVGGFLGIGDHYVAVKPSAINLAYDPGDKKWHATMDANADQLKAAPQFKYPGEA